VLCCSRPVEIYPNVRGRRPSPTSTRSRSFFVRIHSINRRCRTLCIVRCNYIYHRGASNCLIPLQCGKKFVHGKETILTEAANVLHRCYCVNSLLCDTPSSPRSTKFSPGRTMARSMLYGNPRCRPRIIMKQITSLLKVLNSPESEALLVG
jgi:hypothetical protein